MAGRVIRFLGIPVDFIVFLLLEIIALAFIVRGNENQKLIFDNTVGIYSTKIQQRSDRLRSYIGLENVIDSLVEENAQLTQRISNMQFNSEATAPVEEDLVFTAVPAKVISKTTNRLRNYFILNKGRNDGIRKGQGVINRNGVVGLVAAVSDEYCRAELFMHKDHRLSVRLKNSHVFGVMQWEEWTENRYFMDHEHKYFPVNTGDTLVTSGYSLIFPPDLPVGRVKDYRQLPKSGATRVQIEMFQPLSSVRYVYVLQGDFSNQIDSLLPYE